MTKVNLLEASLSAADTLLLAEIALAAEQRVLLWGGGDGRLAVALAEVVGNHNLLVVESDYVAQQAAAVTYRASKLEIASVPPSYFYNDDPPLDSPDATHRLRDAEGSLPSFDLAILHTANQPSHKALAGEIGNAGRWLGDGGRLYVVGARDEGIEAAGRLLTEIFQNSRLVAYKRGQRLYSALKDAGRYQFQPPVLEADLSDGRAELAPRMRPLTIRGQEITLYEGEGIFNRGLLDPASIMLAEAMQIPAGASVLDLGCGGGGLAILAAKLGAARLYLVDSNDYAVSRARFNLSRNGIAEAQLHWGDGANQPLPKGGGFDVVLTNPPFHQGHEQTTATGLRFIATAARLLKPEGSLYLVASRFIKYEPTMRQHLASVSEVAGDGKFKVLLGRKLGAG